MMWSDKLCLLLGAASPFASKDPALATMVPDVKPVLKSAVAKREVGCAFRPHSGECRRRSHRQRRRQTDPYSALLPTPPLAPGR